MIDTACRIASGLSSDNQKFPGTLSVEKISFEAALDIGSDNDSPEIISELSSDDQKLSGDLTTEEIHLDATLDIGSGGRLPNYTGDYTVIPKVYEQTLETKNKSMVDDITVEEIPYSEVSNPQGGNTVNIAYIP